jgi:hypothetical protein
MRYFEVPSADLAGKVSKAFYDLMTPENSTVSTTHLFGWITVAGKTIICIDEGLKCPVYPKSITTATLDKIIDWLKNHLTNQQKTALRNYINNNTVVDLIKLIPASLTEVTEQWIKDNTIKPI